MSIVGPMCLKLQNKMDMWERFINRSLKLDNAACLSSLGFTEFRAGIRKKHVRK